MNQPPPGAARAGTASVELGAHVEAEDSAVTRQAPLVSWEGGIDAVVGKLTGSLMLKRWDGDNNEFELAQVDFGFKFTRCYQNA